MSGYAVGAILANRQLVFQREIREIHSLQNTEMWLAVQYWEVYYNEFSERNRRKEDQDSSKRVTFNDVRDVREIETEHQLYLVMEKIQEIDKSKSRNQRDRVLL